MLANDLFRETRKILKTRRGLH